jgi:hypothetical protein
MQEERARGDVVEDLRHQGFHRRDVLADFHIVLVAIDLPRGAQHQQAELLDLHPRVRDFLLHHLLVGEARALREARQHPLAHHVEGARTCPMVRIA